MESSHSSDHAHNFLLRRSGFSPEYRKEFPWLLPLLKAHNYLHAGLVLDIAATGRTPACGPGCAHCCKQPIPVTPVEILGLILYLRLHPDPARKKSDNPFSCPFLLNDACSAYPMRPIACRRFMVFGSPCQANEAVTETRPQDVLLPSRDILLDSLRLTLPYYEDLGIAPEGPAGMAFFAAHTTFVQNENWGFT